MELGELLKIARRASEHASAEILKIYETDDFGVDIKSDNSPLTKADQKAHEVILSYLEETGIPILSEEGTHLPYEERKNWELLWIVDPLDGTKEFIKRNGEFTVNIALVKEQRPVLGVVEAPVLGFQYYGILDQGAYKVENGETQKLREIQPLDLKKKGIKVVVSRSHLNKETNTFINQLNLPEIVSMGSSLKFMLIAEGKADVYPRFAPTMEWDTAAAHAIINCLGGNVVDTDNNSLLYNKLRVLNPFFQVS